MKKALIWIAVLLLLVSGCSVGSDDAPEPVQPFNFYYQTANTDFSGPEGLIAPELRDLGADNLTDLELFRLYLQGPQRDDLVCPVPKGTELLSVNRSGSVLNLRLSQAYNAQSGVYPTIADACLVKTGLELEGIRQVRIRVISPGGRLLRDVTLSESDILLYDTGETSENTTLTLYFANAAHSFLLTERRTLPAMDADQLPGYVVDLLAQGPQTDGLSPLLPQGTAVLDINVDEGLCAVDFNADFFNNRPESQREEQLTVLSIVNTLCELDEINQVQFYIEGSRVDRYFTLPFDAPFTMDSSVVGPIREELNEFEGILYLPDAESSLLHRFPVRIRPRGSLSQAEALLQTLFRRPGQNGLQNPLEGLTEPLSVTVDQRVCMVELAKDTLPINAAERETVLRILAATLTSLPKVDSVVIAEGGTPVTQSPLSPDAAWFLPQAD